MPVRFGMMVGNPPVAETIGQMIREGVDRIIVLPMFPQYSATTTASVMDSVCKALMRERRVPAIRVVPPYYEHPAYLGALEAIVRDELFRLPWKPDHHLFSFHGIPIRYARSGDPYATHVKRTTAAIVRRLGWPRDAWTQTFQSLFGREEWLKPYTEERLKQLAKQGKRKVFVALPGFTADCLETIDEIGREAREAFRHAGGEELHACPCLNDHPAWIEAMRTIVQEEGQGWLPDICRARALSLDGRHPAERAAVLLGQATQRAVGVGAAATQFDGVDGRAAAVLPGERLHVLIGQVVGIGDKIEHVRPQEDSLCDGPRGSDRYCR